MATMVIPPSMPTGWLRAKKARARVEMAVDGAVSFRVSDLFGYVRRVLGT